MLEGQPGFRSVPVEVFEQIATSGAESHHHDTIGHDVSSHPTEHVPLGTWGHEGHDIPGKNGCGEGIIHPVVGEVEIGEVGHNPTRTRVVLFGSCHELWIRVHPDNHVPAAVQRRPHAPWPTSTIENPRTRGNHCVNESCLSP